MINRKHYGIIAFPTSQAAASAEATAQAEGQVGRLIPMPAEVAAGCGLVLQVPIEKLKEVEELLIRHQTLFEGSYEVWFENRHKTVKRIV